MKTKQINRILVLMASVLLILTFAFSLSACGKFKPKDLTIEQARTELNNAIEKVKTATNVQMNLSENEFTYVDADGYYSTGFENPDEDYYQDTWYIYEDEQWYKYYYFYYGTGEVSSASKEILDEVEDVTTYMELFAKQMSNPFFIPDGLSEFKATQTAKNKIEISMKMDDPEEEIYASVNLIIENGYVTYMHSEATGDDYEEERTVQWSYNIADREIPSLPNVEWIER